MVMEGLQQETRPGSGLALSRREQRGPVVVVEWGSADRYYTLIVFQGGVRFGGPFFCL